MSYDEDEDYVEDEFSFYLSRDQFYDYLSKWVEEYKILKDKRPYLSFALRWADHFSDFLRGELHGLSYEHTRVLQRAKRANFCAELNMWLARQGFPLYASPHESLEAVLFLHYPTSYVHEGRRLTERQIIDTFMPRVWAYLNTITPEWLSIHNRVQQSLNTPEEDKE